MLKDPEYRKARLASLRASIMRSYPGLAEALRLTSEEADQFFNVLANTAGPLDQAARNEIQGKKWALQRQEADSIKALLGQSRYSNWVNYQPTRNSRVQASTFATVLVEAGAPLDAGQLRSLEAAAAGEEKTLMHDIVAIGRTVDAANPQSQIQAQDALKRRQAESSHRILEASTPWLTAQQLHVLRTQIAEQEAIQSAMDGARERAKELQAQP